MVTVNVLRMLARASRAAYLDQPDLESFHSRVFAEGSTHATLFVNNKHVILTFRGTEPDSPFSFYS